MKKKKVVLAFSGGLDTSFCALYLKESGFDVITVTIDTGGFSKIDKAYIEKQAKSVGASKHYFIDGRQELYDKIVSYIIKGNILRGRVYPLCAGPERLIIAAKTVEMAIKEKAEAISHGSTGAGNDQVRFEVALRVLCPKLKIIVPVRDLSVKRSEEIELLKKNKISIPSISKSYSVNRGMLGITVGGSETKESWESPPENAFPGITPLSETPDKPSDIILSFEKGMSVRLIEESRFKDTVEESGISIIEKLNIIGGKHGVGKGIHLGNTIIGIKGRVAFAAPAILILIKAHQELEKLVMTRHQSFWKDILTEAYGNFLHEALYFDPVARDIEAMIDSSQSHVSGEVKVKLFKGNIIVVGVKSPFSLMDSKIAVYGEENALWSGTEAAGFSKLYGLQSILAARSSQNEVAPRKGAQHP